MKASSVLHVPVKSRVSEQRVANIQSAAKIIQNGRPRRAVNARRRRGSQANGPRREMDDVAVDPKGIPHGDGRSGGDEDADNLRVPDGRRNKQQRHLCRALASADDLMPVRVGPLRQQSRDLGGVGGAQRLFHLGQQHRRKGGRIGLRLRVRRGEGGEDAHSEGGEELERATHGRNFSAFGVTAGRLRAASGRKGFIAGAFCVEKNARE